MHEFYNFLTEKYLHGCFFLSAVSVLSKSKGDARYVQGESLYLGHQARIWRTKETCPL